MPYQVIERVPLETYLHTAYSPFCDYVDGEVRERCCGMGMHARMLGALCNLLSEDKHQWGVIPLLLISVKVSESRVRIAEVCLIDRRNFEADICTVPPVLCVEVFQEDDTWEDQMERARDFLVMGVRAMWLIDPYAEKAYRALPDGTFVDEDSELRVEGLPIRLDVKALFGEAKR